ncbi:YeeE/YedE thiosulfate transporter family protein [Corynebacterium camporealensis]|uniref:YeeE/YedE thiosulfate transporter family protein n=1 Tax=Corynebacterium camporealensis TaxID=161896 RepID=UPI0034CF3797
MIATGLAVGVVFGAVLQRGRFCVTGMLRDIFMNKTWRGFTALMILISVHSFGLTLLTQLGIISPEISNFTPAAIMIGGFIFGMGIILSGGCASGTWYRSAEGLVGSWIALLFYGLSAAAMKSGPLESFDGWFKQWETDLTTIHGFLGISPWMLVAVVWVITFFLWRHYRLKDAGRQTFDLGQPWYSKPLPMYTAAILVGIIGTIAFPLSAATGRNSGLGITTPSADVMRWSTTGDDSYMNWGTMLVIGLFIGAFIAAKVAGEFRVRVPDAQTAYRSIGGGIMMGVGASLAGGCTVGNGMVETSLFSFKGWIALLFIALGVGFGAKLWLKPRKANSGQPTANYNTTDAMDNAPVNTGGESAQNRAANDDNVYVPQLNLVNATSAVSLATKPKTPEKARPLGNGRYALDTLGAVCPFPLIEAKQVMAELQPGEALVIDFDCTQATDSIPAWAADEGHTVEDFKRVSDAGWQMTVVKGG